MNAPSSISYGICCFTFVLATVAGNMNSVAQEDKVPPVRIYLLVGQSNMQGKGSIEGTESNSLRHLVQNDRDKKFQFLVNQDGTWKERSDVSIHYDLFPFRELRYGPLKPGYGSSSGQIGPELGFGHVVGDATLGKVLLIKAAWGGKSLGHNFLPPSVGKYPPPVEPDDPGYFYHRILQLADEVTANINTYLPEYDDQGLEIAGLCFHQGWNDQYGGLDEKYEGNLAAFIKDIRSWKHGLGVPGLPVVIATSGMIRGDSLVKKGQLAMSNHDKYPQFAGNVAVVDTENPYGPQKMVFKFYTKKSPDSVGYHWNNHARSYLNIGRAMAAEMQKLSRPESPSRLAAAATPKGIRLTWQLGTTTPNNVTLQRDGKKIDTDIAPHKTTFIDSTALPGKHHYELVLNLHGSENPRLKATCDTSVKELKAYRSLKGVELSWKALGKYQGFQILREGKVIDNKIPGDHRSFTDSLKDSQGKVRYSVKPTTGTTTPANLTLNLGPLDPGDALIYEPFDYAANAQEPKSLLGQRNAVGLQGNYFYLSDNKLERSAAAIGGGLNLGDLPVTGNRGSSHRWSPGTAIAIDDSLKRAGLLKDGATLWISYVAYVTKEIEHRQGGGSILLCSEDLKEGVGFQTTPGEFRTAVVVDGKTKPVRITSARKETPTLVVGKIVWGKDVENDSFVPYLPKLDLVQPEKHGRPAAPFNIDQTKLSLLVLRGEGQFDEIRVGPTYESVIGGGTKKD